MQPLSEAQIKKDAIRIPYPGDCISVNHYLGRRKGGGYYIKQETRDWKEQFQWLLLKCHLEDYKLPLEVTCSGWFKNERSAPDLSNLSKVIMDSIQELIGIDDKSFRWHDGTRNIGEKDPYLLITLSEVVPKVLPDALQSNSSGSKEKSGMNRSPIKKISQKQQEKINFRVKMKPVILESQGGKCKLCGCSKPDWRGWMLHHREKLSQGGKDTKDNLIVVCGRCHDLKHGLVDIDSHPMWSKKEV